MVPQPDDNQSEGTTRSGALSPGASVSHYRIIEKIGAGGMGVVYKAEDTELRRTVALKFLAPQALGSPQDKARLIREAQAAAALDHPNICTVHEIGRADGDTFIVMAYVEGQSLEDLIEAGPLGLEEALDLTVQVSHGLKAAHDKGIVHRDIKPANIMITSDGVAKIMDFGLAKSAGQTRLTGTAMTLGTVAYMSPEQSQGEEIDRRTDIWSLGVLLYQMLTGSLPFKGGYDLAIIYSILNEDPKPMSELKTDIPSWLEEVVSRALVKNPDERYQSVDEIISDIECRQARPRRQLKPRTILLFLVAVALGVGVTVIVSRRPKRAIEPKRIYMACLPFENKTGEAHLDWLVSGIPDNLTADLAQSSFFRVMSPERVHQVVREIGKDLSKVGTAEAMDLLGKATELDAVAVGSFIKAGTEIRITMKIENLRDRELVGSTIVDDTEGRLLDLIDQLTVETKKIFQLSQENIDQDLDRGVGLQRTRSVKAASDFSSGLGYSYACAFLEAAEAFQAAIEADPDFAMAYAKASEAYKNLGYDDKAESLSLIAVDKVVEFIDRVPPADRTFVLANHADIINNVDQALESYHDFTEIYPDDPEGYYNLGFTYASISEWDLAAENFEQALRLDSKFGAARFELGKVLIGKNDLEAALAELGRVLDYYREIGSREGEATVLNAIGVVHRRRNEFEQAISYFEISIKIKEELGDKRGIAASLGNLGLVYMTMGESDSAFEVLQRSLAIKREIGDQLGTSTALNKIGQIYQSRGKYDEALTYFERSYEIRKDLGVKHLMASSLSDMATIYVYTGQYEKASQVDSMVLALRMEIGDVRGEAQSLGNIAGGLRIRGRLEEASVCLRRALTIGRDLGDDLLLASLDYQLGRHCLARGKVDSALVHYSRALEAYEDLDVKPWVANTLASMGSARHLKGEYSQALGDFNRARTMAEAAGERDVVVAALADKSRLFYELGYWPGCDSTMAEIASHDDDTISHGQRWSLELQKARRLKAMNQVSEALDITGDVVASCRHIGVKIEGMLLLGEMASDRGDTEEAWRMVNQAVQEARRHSLRDYEAEGLRLQAGIRSDEDKPDDAVRLSDDALRIIEGRGICGYEYLVTCGDVRLAAGRGAEGISFYTRALEVAAATLHDKCPAGLRTYYIERKRILEYVALVEDLCRHVDKSADLPDYRALFSL